MSNTNNSLRNAAIIVLFGPTGSGKTTFANIASGDSMRIGRGLTSCTQEVQPTTMFTVDGQPVVIIDSPGFDDTFKSDAEILNAIAGFLSAAYTRSLNITGLIFMHKITDTRIGGKALLHMNMFRQICGLDALKNVVYVTNMWSKPPTYSEKLREAELRGSDQFFAVPLAKGAQMSRHDGTRESAHNVIRKVLPRAPRVTRLARELVDGHVPLEKTKAGAVLGLELEKEIRRLNAEINMLRESHAQAIREKDERYRRAIAEEERKRRNARREHEEEMRRLKRGYDNTTMECVMNDLINQLVESHEQELEDVRASEQARRQRLMDTYNSTLPEKRNRSGCIIA